MSASLIVALISALALATPGPLAAQPQPNEPLHVDLLPSRNLAAHRTPKYQPYARALVLRRGQPLEVLIHLAHPFNRTRDRIRLEFAFGANPQLADGSLHYVPLAPDPDQSPGPRSGRLVWAARVLDINRRQLHVQIDLPPDAPVGAWRVKLSTKLAGANNARAYSLPETLYILFNPWCPHDHVYLAHEDARQEYVLNELGKIYIGSYSRPVGRKWAYDQFEAPVLSAVVHMLDRSRLTTADRANVVKVARAVSALVNSHDDAGFLVGNWSGSYGDGLAPWQWTGSAGIFRRFVQTGFRSVRFGQCWVFGGVTTTTLRTLGIPARTISNFVSAHDTDFSLTVDKFYTDRGGEMSGVNGDSIWNFHVWSDAWMARPDLPPGFGGWQAIDATPQERSMGMFQLGPASLEAIKQGKVSFAYDVGFVYSEVNADLVYWHLDARTRLQWRKTRVQGGHVGRKILTKMIGVIDDKSRSGANDAEDIVHQYKYAEGTLEARRARAEAARAAGLLPLFGDT